MAPARINDLGGWTDTWFAGFGSVLSVSVQPGIECLLVVEDTGDISKGGVAIKIKTTGESFYVDPNELTFKKNPIIEAVIFSEGVPKDFHTEISVRSAMPFGAGTGTSASLAVALLGTLRKLKSADCSPASLWREAHRIETEVLGLESGIQDQICASYGGICFIEIPQYPDAKISRVSLPEEIVKNLDRTLLLVFLGSAHQSSEVHTRVIEKLKSEGLDTPEIETLRKTAFKGLQALLLGDLELYGSVMIENNEAQRSLHPELIPKEADLVIEIAKRNDALGWKVNGAGGSGGSMTVLLPDEPQTIEDFKKEINELGLTDKRAMGIRIVETKLDPDGFRVEFVSEENI